MTAPRPQFIYLCSAALSLFLLSSCSQDEEVAVGAPSEISFALNAQTASEGQGIVKININLDKPQPVRTVLNFRVGGNAVSSLQSMLQADYELITDPPLIIPEGETSAAIELRILEDENFEPELENIIFSLDAVLEGNAVLSEDLSQLSHTYSIQENDYQLFLEWENPEIDMNLYVEMPNKGLLASENSTGFEKVTITNARENVQYYIDVWINESSSEVQYSLKFQKAGENLKETLVNDNFKPMLPIDQEEKRTEVLKNYLLVKAGRDLRIL